MSVKPSDYVPAVNAMVLHKGHAPRQMERDRVCGEKGCDTQLSIYNCGKLCSVHEPTRPFYQRTPRKGAA